MCAVVFFGLLVTFLQASSHTVSKNDFDNLKIEPSIDVTLSSDKGKECLTEHKLDTDAISGAFGEDQKLIEGNEQVNKYLYCVWKKYGYITGNEEIVGMGLLANQKIFRAVGIENIDQIVYDILKDCRTVSPANSTDIAVKVHNCIMDHAVKYGDKVSRGVYTPDEACLDEPGLDRKVAEEVVEAYQKVPEGKVEINRYLNCLWKHYNWLTEDGKVDPFPLRSFVEARVLSSVGRDDFFKITSGIVKVCETLNGDNLADKIVKTYNCIIEQVKQYNDTKAKN